MREIGEGEGPLLEKGPFPLPKPHPHPPKTFIFIESLTAALLQASRTVPLWA